LLRRTVGSSGRSAGPTNTSFAGEIVSQARRKTPAMVAKIRSGAHFPKFALHRRTFFCELRKVMGTSKVLILVPLSI
jgi:hypothetical protein